MRLCYFFPFEHKKHLKNVQSINCTYSKWTPKGEFVSQSRKNIPPLGPLLRSQDLIASKQSHLFLCLSLMLRSSFLFKAAARWNSLWTWREGSSLSDKLFTCFLHLKRIESDSPTPGIQTLCWANMGRVGGSQGWSVPFRLATHLPEMICLEQLIFHFRETTFRI